MIKRINLNIQVLCEALLLLAVTLGILAYFSHMALRQEALRNAEQTLEGTVQDIDNILLGVEQSTGNIYYDLLEHLDDPERMYTYSRELVASNPNINGCAICFKPGYFPGHDLFMAYVHRTRPDANGNSRLVTSEAFTDRPYTKQRWYAEPMKTGEVGWIDPLKGHETEDEPLITFCLPFNDKNGERVGMMGVDVSLNQLSDIILDAKPSENGYSVLLAHNGAYIVHPDEDKLKNPEIFSQTGRDSDPTEIEAAKAMVAGEKGMKEFIRDSKDWLVFYKPFERVEWEGRSEGKLGWSVGVVYPEEDIFGIHNILVYLVVGIAIAGMLVFYLLLNWIIRRQLKPLIRLTKSAHYIASGNYSESLPYSDRLDEIGLLQNQFCDMQRSLQGQVDELEEETKLLKRQNDMLRAAYDKTVEGDKMKSSFLRYITNQMAEPMKSIDNSVTSICNNYQNISKEEMDQLVDNIQRQNQTMTNLLNPMAHFTKSDTGKEADHA